MKIFKSIGKFFVNIIKTTQKGFYFICLLFSRGFYFYFYKLASLVKKIFRRSKVADWIVSYFKKKQENPAGFIGLVVTFVIVFYIFNFLYIDTNEIVKLDDGQVVSKEENQDIKTEEVKNRKETNLFKKYGNMSLSEVDFNELKMTNNQVVSWLSVDGTNINYPIVQTTDNDYYLSHSIDNKSKSSGWPFMDFRNSYNMGDDNTIFYGHNLLNKNSFGSLNNVFSKNWFKSSNHLIIVLTDTMKYTYEIFSAYYVEPESYYLQTNFMSDDDYLEFVNTLKNRSVVSFSTNISSNDKIITLSTCTNDNNNRQVVHAKLISEVSR